jgi:pyruvate,orthophosphate dikinase
MVYGNMGATSGSGVAFTRNPATGQNQLYLDFLFNAQGEDLVSGKQSVASSAGLARVLPGIYAEILALRKRLEMEFKDMQDFEFTVQEGKLFLLQTRNGKRTPWAAVQIAADMVSEGIIDKTTAVNRLKTFDLDKVQRRVLAQSAKTDEPLSRGVPASDGVAVGQIVFDSESASRYQGFPLILVRDAISTEDVSGIALCAGILTRTGGKTSHAAVVARQMGKVCVVGCGDMTIDTGNRTCDLRGKTLHERDFISLDGGTGAVYEGKVEVVVEKPTLLSIVKEWMAEGSATSSSGPSN